MSERVAYLIVLFGAVLWGTTGTAQAFIPRTVDPIIVATLRLAIGGFSLLLIMSLIGKLNFTKWPWKRTFVTAVCLAVFQYFFFSSVRLTGVAIGTVLSIGSAPVFAGIIESVFLKKSPSRQWLIATILAIIGCSILFFNKELVVFSPLGVMFALGAGMLFALYTLANKTIVAQTGALRAVAVVFTLSAFMLLPFFFLFQSTGIMTRTGLLAILYIGIVTTSIGYVLFSTGLTKIPSSSATTLALAEPLTAAILSVFVVGEYLNTSAWFGIFLLLGGIVVLSFKGNMETVAGR